MRTYIVTVQTKTTSTSYHIKADHDVQAEEWAVNTWEKNYEYVDGGPSNINVKAIRIDNASWYPVEVARFPK